MGKSGISGIASSHKMALQNALDPLYLMKDVQNM